MQSSHWKESTALNFFALGQTLRYLLWYSRLLLIWFCWNNDLPPILYHMQSCT